MLEVILMGTMLETNLGQMLDSNLLEPGLFSFYDFLDKRTWSIYL